MSDVTPKERLTPIREFWNSHARWNAKIAIYDSPDVRNDDTRDQAFDEAGQRDAGLVAPFLSPQAHVVDLGCGIGRVVRHVAPQCKEITGVDISDEMIEKATEYLADRKNVKLVRGEGSSLEAIPDASIDLLYSLLVLIHVDRRSFYRYLREMKRVIKPDGIVYLQFQNILTPEGIDKWERVLDMEIEYPLEFYTLEELHAYFQRQGFEVIGTQTHAEYIFLTAIKGSADRWLERAGNGIEVTVDARTGSLAEGAVDLKQDGEIVAKVKSSAEVPLGYALYMIVAPPEGDGSFYHYLTAPVSVPPNATTELRVKYQAADRTARLEVNGVAPTLQDARVGTLTKPGNAHVNVGLLPPGFSPTPDAVARFPHLTASYPIQVQ